MCGDYLGDIVHDGIIFDTNRDALSFHRSYCFLRFLIILFRRESRRYWAVNILLNHLLMYDINLRGRESVLGVKIAEVLQLRLCRSIVYYLPVLLHSIFDALLGGVKR